MHALEQGPGRYCQVNGTNPRFSPKRQESRNLSTDARRLPPVSERSVPEESMVNCFEVVPTDSKPVLDRTVNCE